MRRVNIVEGSLTEGWRLTSEPYDEDSLPIVLPQIRDQHPQSQILVLPEAFTYSPPELVLMDVDSTLIDEEVIDLLAQAAGVGGEIAEVTHRAMAGEIDFEQSLRHRVALLAGLPAKVLDEVRAAVTPTFGVEEFIAELQALDARVAVVSGGFSEIVDPLAAELGIDAAFANGLEVADGVLTGELRGPIVDPAFKAHTLTRLTREFGADPELTVAIGDGANDREMVAEAGCGIAFCAKPALREAADCTLDMRDFGILQAIFITPFQTSRYELS